LTPQEIDAEIVVFDGGNSTTLPIKPPDGVLWRSISVHQLHVDDETQPTLGLTYPKIQGVRPFIRMPHQMSLDIIAEVSLEKITISLTACENSDVLHWVVVMQNVSSRTMASVSVMPVLDLSP